jgi:hypothetical protein
VRLAELVRPWAQNSLAHSKRWVERNLGRFRSLEAAFASLCKSVLLDNLDTRYRILSSLWVPRGNMLKVDIANPLRIPHVSYMLEWARVRMHCMQCKRPRLGSKSFSWFKTSKLMLSSTLDHIAESAFSFLRWGNLSVGIVFCNTLLLLLRVLNLEFIYWAIPLYPRRQIYSDTPFLLFYLYHCFWRLHPAQWISTSYSKVKYPSHSPSSKWLTPCNTVLRLFYRSPKNNNWLMMSEYQGKDIK